MAMQDIKQIAIIGTGLLGGSMGLALRAAGWEGNIVGVGRRQATVDRAKSRGCIDDAVTDVAPAVRSSQLVVMATPLGAYRALLEQIAEHEHSELIITDVGSVKQRVCADARQLLADPSRFVGSHPMAGSEQQGPDHAHKDLFRDQLCIVTPEGTNSSPHAMSVVESLWSMLGMRTTINSPQEHDELVAVISHLPHAVAAMLVTLADQRKAMSVASTGFRDTTRIASGDPTVWRDIFETNRSAVIDAIDGFMKDMADVRQLLADGQDERIFEILTQAKAARDTWLNRSTSPPHDDC